MKKNLKKILALIMTAAMMFTLLTACGGGGETQNPDGDNPGDETLSITPKVLGQDEIKIAYIPISTAGVTNKMVELAFNDTIDAYKDTITVDYFDPGYDAQTQINMVNERCEPGLRLYPAGMCRSCLSGYPGSGG